MSIRVFNYLSTREDGTLEINNGTAFATVLSHPSNKKIKLHGKAWRNSTVFSP